MNSVDKRQLKPEKLLCHSLVCGKHKFLYHPVCRTPFAQVNAYGNSLFIKSYIRLVKIKIKTACGFSFASQYLRKFFHIHKHIIDIAVLCGKLSVVILNYIRHVSIYHAVL